MIYFVVYNIICALLIAVILLDFFTQVKEAQNINLKTFLKSKINRNIILPSAAQKNVKRFKEAKRLGKANKELFNQIMLLIKQRSNEGHSTLHVPSNPDSDDLLDENYFAVAAMLGELGYYASFDGEVLQITW